MKGENCFNYQVSSGVLYYLSDGVSESPLSKQISFKISGGTGFRRRALVFVEVIVHVSVDGIMMFLSNSIYLIFNWVAF